VAGLVSKELESESIVVFDEVSLRVSPPPLSPGDQMSAAQSKCHVVVIGWYQAHNIDNVCIEALSVQMDERSLAAATRCLGRISSEVSRVPSGPWLGSRT